MQQRVVVWVLLGALSSGFAYAAESFQLRHQRDLAANPPGLHFRLEVDGAARSFHLGERIPLTLVFWSDVPDKFKLSAAAYDRSGRLPSEELVLEQTGVVDPYMDFFGTGVLSYLGGGHTPMPILTHEPERIPADLNDWFRFDKPGVYRVYLKSHRLTRAAEPGEGDSPVVHFAAVSNILTVNILPEDPAWQAAKLRQIGKTLTEPSEEAHPPVVAGRLNDEQRMAFKELVYLGTPAAIELAFRESSQPGGFVDPFLVLAARNRQHVVATFDRYLCEPKTPIRESEVRLRAFFTWLAADQPKRLPFASWQFDQEPDWKALQAEAADRHHRFEKAVRAEAIRLIPVAAAKPDEHRKASLNALASLAPDHPALTDVVERKEPLPPRSECIARFLHLPERQQMELLTSEWAWFRGPDVLPVLRSLVHRTSSADQPETGMRYSRELAELALERLHELSPAETRELVLGELAAGNTRFAQFAMRELPVREMPEADAAFARLLEKPDAGVFALVARFGSAGIAARMDEWYQSRHWFCADAESFLIYSLRTMPPEVSAERLARAMADRYELACHQTLLPSIARTVWNPVVEAQALQSLDDSDVAAAAGAVAALAAHGTAAAEAAIWKRLEQWSGQWAGRAADLDGHPIAGTAFPNQKEFGQALFDAIASAKSWRFDEERRMRLWKLCIDQDCRRRWAEPALSTSPRIAVERPDFVPLRAFRVGLYRARNLDAVKEKVRQYPAGTVFRWCPGIADIEASALALSKETFQELKAHFLSRSLHLEPDPAAECRAQSDER